MAMRVCIMVICILSRLAVAGSIPSGMAILGLCRSAAACLSPPSAPPKSSTSFSLSNILIGDVAASRFAYLDSDGVVCVDSSSLAFEFLVCLDISCHELVT